MVCPIDMKINFDILLIPISLYKDAVLLSFHASNDSFPVMLQLEIN
jgi:hypothetical protein